MHSGLLENPANILCSCRTGPYSILRRAHLLRVSAVSVSRGRARWLTGQVTTFAVVVSLFAERWLVRAELRPVDLNSLERPNKHLDCCERLQRRKKLFSYTTGGRRVVYEPQPVDVGSIETQLSPQSNGAAAELCRPEEFGR